MQLDKKVKNQLTFYEREKIEYYLKLGRGKNEIGRCIKKDPSVVKRELQRNSNHNGIYIAKQAQEKYERRKHKRKGRKIEKDKDLENYVKKEISSGKSPDVIAGRLKNRNKDVCKKYPELIGKSISHESIYDYIYNGDGKYGGLYKHLLYKRPKRQKQKSRKTSIKIGIPERLPISERPEEVNAKTEIGHWETDTMVFSKSKECLSVQVERKVEFLKLHKVKDKTAESTEEAIRKTIDDLPDYFFKTMTYDNGTENVNHVKIKRDYMIENYFCDTYCSWQKGCVENMNKIIRRFFPKNTDLSKVSEEEVCKVEKTINNMYRKSLDYYSANEVMHKELNLC